MKRRRNDSLPNPIDRFVISEKYQKLHFYNIFKTKMLYFRTHWGTKWKDIQMDTNCSLSNDIKEMEIS